MKYISLYSQVKIFKKMDQLHWIINEQNKKNCKSTIPQTVGIVMYVVSNRCKQDLISRKRFDINFSKTVSLFVSSIQIIVVSKKKKSLSACKK